MSVITYGRLYYGARKSQQPEQAKTRLDHLRELIPVSQLPDDAHVFMVISVPRWSVPARRLEPTISGSPRMQRPAALPS